MKQTMFLALAGCLALSLLGCEPDVPDAHPRVHVEYQTRVNGTNGFDYVFAEAGLGDYSSGRSRNGRDLEGLSEFASDTAITNNVSARAHQAQGFAETGRIICYRKQL